MPNELAIPPGALTDKQAHELVRAWAAHGGLQCFLNPSAWPKDMAAIGWGILLSDIARHVADALQQTNHLDKSSTLAQIRSVFDKEIDEPTADTSAKLCNSPR